MCLIYNLRKKEEYNEDLETWRKGGGFTLHMNMKNIYISYVPEKIRQKWRVKKI